MTKNKPDRVCLFSKISGLLTRDGAPLAYVKLVRTSDQDGQVKEETTTDAEGVFEFPALFARGITHHLPQEFVVAQNITAWVD